MESDSCLVNGLTNSVKDETRELDSELEDQDHAVNSETMDKDQQIKDLKEEVAMQTMRANDAGELGLALLRTNNDLTEQLQKESEKYEKQIEGLQQEVHTLGLKLELHNKTDAIYEEELSRMRSELEASYNKQISLLEQNHNSKVAQLNRHIDELSNELTLREEQLDRSKAAISEKDKEISKLREAIACQSNTSLPHEDVSKAQLSSLQQQCDLLADELQKQIEATCEANEVKEMLQAKVTDVEQVLREKERLALEWYQSLKESQEEVTILRADLEQMKIKNLREDWQAQGNSLFAEVEDRRLQADRDVIKYKVKCETLERTHNTLLQSYKKLKIDFSALLCRHSSVAADADQVHRLQQALNQRNSELEEANWKLNKLEKQKELSSKAANSMDFGDKKEYIQYLEYEHKEMQEKLTTLTRELELKSTQLIWECKKLCQTEAKLHKAEKEKAKLMNESIKTKLKLNEALEKHGDDKSVVKSLEKEVEILKQQLQGKIKTGKTYSTAPKHQTIKKEEDVGMSVLDKGQSGTDKIKKKDKVAIPVVNLLEELHKATNVDNTTTNGGGKTSGNDKEPGNKRESILQPSLNITAKTTPTLLDDGDNRGDNVENIKPTAINESKADYSAMDLTACSRTLPVSPDKVKPQVQYRKIKASESGAKFQEQCKQQ